MKNCSHTTIGLLWLVMLLPAFAIEGWILSEVRTDPKAEEKEELTKETRMINTPWWYRTHTSVDSKTGQVTAHVDYFLTPKLSNRVDLRKNRQKPPDGPRQARYSYHAKFSAPPSTLVPGKTFKITASGHFTRTKRFQPMEQYDEGFIIQVLGDEGNIRLYLDQETKTDSKTLTKPTTPTKFEVGFGIPDPIEARRKLAIYQRPGRPAKVPEIRISGAAGAYISDAPRITWVYRLGEIGDPDKPQAEIVKLDALDANPKFFKETDLVDGKLKPTALILSSTTRKGTTADGVSQLIFRAEINQEVPVVFQITEGRTGKLEPLFGGKTLTLNEKHYAFAQYTPPDSFAKKGTVAKTSTLTAPKKRFGGNTGPECKDLIIEAVPYVPTIGGKAKARRAGLKKLDLALTRPPVVLVHGLFSDPVQCWTGLIGEGKSFAVLLERAGFVPFMVNYSRSNGRYLDGESWLTGKNRSSDFASNWNVVWESPDKMFSIEKQSAWLKGKDSEGWLGIDRTPILSAWQKPSKLRIGGIKAALKHYRTELGLAATQADLIGHSMGGVLSRVYASPNFNPTYKRVENFFKGDIHRLITMNSPHFGSELAEMAQLLRPARVGKEAATSWARRRVASALFNGFIANSEAGALLDMRTDSKALPKIGPTPIPSFAIVSEVNHGQLGKSEHDPGSAYLMAYSGIGMLFFNNPGLLDEAIKLRSKQWTDAGELAMRTARDGRAPGRDAHGAGGVVNFGNETGTERYARILKSGMDENVHYWASYREADFREAVRKQIEDTIIVPYGLFDANGEMENAFENFTSFVSYMLLGGDVKRVRSDDIAPDIPHGVIDALRNMIFQGDTENDGAVRSVSQAGGLPSSAVATFKGIAHSFAPWDYRVQREAIRILRWEDSRFAKEGFPAAGQAMPKWLPSAAFAEARVDGDLGIAWSGMVKSHAEEYLNVADRMHTVILARPVNQDSTALIEAGAATKGMAIKGKSSNWGPQRGLIPVKQRFSKIWRTKNGTERDNDIIEYDGINRDVIDNQVYPKDPETPHLEGRKMAVERALIAQVAGKPYQVLIDENEKTDSEAALFLFNAEAGKLYDWRTSTENQNGKTIAIFDCEKAPSKEITGEIAERVIKAKAPMTVVCDGLSDLDPKPYLTADYDLLAIGFHRSDNFHGVPNDVKSAQFHDLRGYISVRQHALVKMLNSAVREGAGYTAGNVTHHGPEVQYAKSPYIDYPILVFDPKEPKDGDGEVFIIRQGPVGFRDIHLKRFFSEKINDGFNLWPNPVSKGWSWEHFHKFNKNSGYDPRDSPDLKKYVAEQLRPKRIRTSTKPVIAKVEKRLLKTEPKPPAPEKPAPKKRKSPKVETKSKPLLSEKSSSKKKAQSKMSFQELAAMAETGSRSAQNRLGVRYAKGSKGAPKDSKKALHWIRKAAEAGLPSGQLNLAHRYYNGTVIPRDYKLAFEWYLKAAKGGNANGQTNVGFMYARGKGVKKNTTKAAHWYEIAAKQGDAMAHNNLGGFYEKGIHYPQNYKRAFSYYQKAAYKGLALGQRNLADLYAEGRGVRKSKVSAYAWYTIASNNRDKIAIKRRDAFKNQMSLPRLQKAKKLSQLIIREIGK